MSLNAKAPVAMGGANADAPVTEIPAPCAGMIALCRIARFHQIAADPHTLAHQLGLTASAAVCTDDLLRAAQHLGLKARLVKSSVERLKLTRLCSDRKRGRIKPTNWQHPA